MTQINPKSQTTKADLTTINFSPAAPSYRYGNMVQLWGVNVFSDKQRASQIQRISNFLGYEVEYKAEFADTNPYKPDTVPGKKYILNKKS